MLKDTKQEGRMLFTHQCQKEISAPQRLHALGELLCCSLWTSKAALQFLPNPSGPCALFSTQSLVVGEGQMAV